MINRCISDDLKKVAICLRDCGCDSDNKICCITAISLSTLHCAQQCQHLTRDVAKASAIGCDHPCKLIHMDCQYLIQLAHHKPTLFLNEYNHHLAEYCHLPTSLATIQCTLTCGGLNVKHVQKLTSKRNSLKHAAFICCIYQYPAHYLITLNEVSKDNRTYARMWGQAHRGKRMEKHYPFVRKERFSVLGAMALDEGFIATQVVKGSFTHELFL
ncbi:hypothetical protein DFH29DRAFT_806497 [Suillus ampliporus]|nr:hypothetical protein DFH29DRAFT_806497 [Suillus ampliporus]